MQMQVLRRLSPNSGLDEDRTMVLVTNQVQ